MLRRDSKAVPQHKAMRRSITTIKRDNGVGLSSPRTGNPARQVQAPQQTNEAAVTPAKTRQRSDDNGNVRNTRFFLSSLPIELRLEVYEFLLCTPRPIVISPRRRQIKTNVACIGCRRKRCKCQGPRDEFWDRPRVAILRTCKQINQEATTVLYRQNEFIIGTLIHAPYNAAGFFLWYLRQSTLLQIKSITFRAGCCCLAWLNGRRQEWKTSGKVLAKKGSALRSMGALMPSPPKARLMHETIIKKVREDDIMYYVGCVFCRKPYKSPTPN